MRQRTNGVEAEMSKSVTFLCDDDIHKAIQKEADKNFEGNFSFALRKILKDWNEAN